MPLVTLTCKNMFYPRQWNEVPEEYMGSEILRFGRALPELIMGRKERLLLGPETTEAAVQVDFRRFHVWAVNPVDCWIHIQLTEFHEEKEVRDQVTDEFTALIEEWFLRHNLRMSWALDVFFGPGHGCFTDNSGNIINSW